MDVVTALRAMAGGLIALSVCASAAVHADPLTPRRYLEPKASSSEFMHPAELQTLEVRARARATSAFRWKRKSKHESAFRPRKIAILRYKTPVQVGRQEMMFKFRAPGKGKAIATVEIEF